MSQLIDLTGQRFGMLTVLEKTTQTVQHGSTRSPLWLCRCDCGHTTLVRLDSITSGNIKSCGCQENEGKSEKMRAAAGYVSGTQISKIIRSLKHNATAVDEDMIGVTYDKRSRKWQANLTFRRHRYRLGSYNTPREAAEVRRAAEREWLSLFWSRF